MSSSSRRPPYAWSWTTVDIEMSLSREPRYALTEVAVRCDVHPKTVRQYEELGLVAPVGETRSPVRFSDQDIDRILRIRRLVEDLGVNFAGVEVILHLRDQLIHLQRAHGGETRGSGR